MSVQVRNPSLKTENSFLKSDVNIYFEIISLSFQCGMDYLIQFDVYISRIEVKSLLALTFEQNNITVFHTFFKFELEVSWRNCDLIPSTDWTFMTCSNTRTTTCLTFHFHFLDFILHLYFSEHLSSSTTARAGFFFSTLVTSALTMFADFSSSETIDHIASCVELVQWNPHFSPEISSFAQRIFLEFLETSFTMEIISNTFGNINEYLVGPFDFDVLLLDIIVASIAIWVILNGKPSERFLEFIARSFFSDFQQFIEVGFALTLYDNNEKQQCQDDRPSHYKI